MDAISLQRISLVALIIALGQLVDDAMIAVEVMITKIEEGYDKIEAATFAYTSTAFPMPTGDFGHHRGLRAGRFRPERSSCATAPTSSTSWPGQVPEEYAQLDTLRNLMAPQRCGLQKQLRKRG